MDTRSKGWAKNTTTIVFSSLLLEVFLFDRTQGLAPSNLVQKCPKSAPSIGACTV